MGEDTESRLLKLLRAKPMSVSEVARELGLRRDFTAGYLEAMRSKGLVNLVKVGRSHVYIPKK